MEPDTLLAELRTREVPPLDVDIDRAVATGRRRVRIRRAVVGVVAAATGLAVVGGALVALDGVGARRTEEPPPPVGGSVTATSRACTVQTLTAPPGAAHTAPTAVDPGGRYVAGTVPGSEETGESGAAVLWDGGQVRDLGVTGLSPTPSGVTSTGTVVGTVTRDHRLVAWVYRDGRVTVLPSLAGRPMSAEGIDERGDIVGVAYGEHDRNTAVVWPAAQPGTVRALVAPGSAGALDIAADGSVVGYADENQPFVWAPDGTGRQLPNVPGATSGTVLGLAGDWAYGVGSAVVGDTAASEPALTKPGPVSRTWSVRWNVRDGRVEALATVEARAVTAAGAVVGMSAEVGQRRPYRAAVLVSSDGTSTALPHVDAQRNVGTATAVTPDGRVVVGEENTDRTTVPVRWTC